MLAGFDIKLLPLFNLSVTCFSLCCFLFLLGIQSFNWPDKSSGSHQSDNPNFKMSDRSSIKDKWTSRLTFKWG